jgi:hypothetical protein
MSNMAHDNAIEENHPQIWTAGAVLLMLQAVLGLGRWVRPRLRMCACTAGICLKS